MNLREEDQLPPPPPSAPSTEAQTARLTAQALNTGKIQERESSEDSNGVSKNTSMSNNRKADGGLKSYFVSLYYHVECLSAHASPSASFPVWQQA